MSYVITARSKRRQILYHFGPFETQEEADIAWGRIENHPDWIPDEVPTLNDMSTLDDGHLGPAA